MHYDKIIIGAGIYGLYAALKSSEKGEKILLIEYDQQAFMRASYINQARVHNGYHYPRSISTAIKSARYFDRFNKDYGFCINSNFEQVYATSKNYSWTNADAFIKFCKDVNIKCEEINPNKYFNENACDGAFITQEYTYDAMILRDYFIQEISKKNSIEILYNCRIFDVSPNSNLYTIKTNYGTFSTSYVLNSTYASTNQIADKFKLELFPIKYELCEIILCKVNDNLKNTGITVMDGPFLSLMPFGKTDFHSLTSVTFTPHSTSYELLPEFECQRYNDSFCNKEQLNNCNLCKYKPSTSWNYMSNLAKKYILDELKFEYIKSIYSVKPILKLSEMDDSRPTVIKVLTEKPKFVSVLSGKINTIYDLDEYL